MQCTFLSLQLTSSLAFTRNLTGTSFIFLSLKRELFCMFRKDLILVVSFLFSLIIQTVKYLYWVTEALQTWHMMLVLYVPIEYQKLCPGRSLQSTNRVLIEDRKYSSQTRLISRLTSEVLSFLHYVLSKLSATFT